MDKWTYIPLPLKEIRKNGEKIVKDLGTDTNRDKKREKENKTPKGIMRSAVPLPCFFDVLKSQGVAGQRP